MSADILLFPPDSLALGREALVMADGDLLAACQHQPELKAEAALAWLYIQVARRPEGALELVRMAADVVEEAG